MKSIEDHNKSEDENKTATTICDVMANVAKRQSLKEYNLKFNTPNFHEEEFTVHNASINDIYMKMNEEDENEDREEEDLLKLSKKDRHKFLNKIKENK